jgi:branched-chain amino acid transport system permease protein
VDSIKLRRNIGSYVIIAVLLIALLVMPTLVSSYWIHVLMLMLLYGILAVSLRQMLILGQVSFAHPAFMAIGAYTSTMLVMNLGLPFWFTIFLAGFASGIVAFLLGLPVLRLTGPYFFLATFAFLEVVRMILTHFYVPFGGPMGIYNIPPPNPIGPINFSSISHFYYLILIVFVITLLFFYSLERSRFGQSWHAIGQSHVLAESLGVNVMGYRVLAFVIACFFAGIAGACYAHYMTHMSPMEFGLTLSVDIIVWAVVGGMGSVFGPAVGAGILTFIPQLFKFTAEYETGLSAVIFIIIILFLRGGLVSLPRVISMRIRKEKSIVPPSGKAG